MTLLAERLMGAAECGFDSVPYGRRIENEAERRLISACQLDLARSYLAALGDLSTRIASIAPATLSWLAAPGESETKAVLHLGADSSLLVVSDASSGVVAQRHIRVGAHEYRFENDRLVATELDERTQQRQKANASKDKTADGKKAAKPPQKFLGLTLPQRGGAGSEITPLKLAALGVCGAGLIGFLALDFAISPAAARLARSGADYDAAQIRISALEAQLGKLRAAARQDAFSAAGADKILWAEKFAAIAEALPPSVWLTGAAIAKTDRRVGNIDVVTTKLVLHGVTRAESDQRLQDIAQFIQSLEEDQSFMRDFRRIVFAGLGAPASENATSAASGVTFEVHAWYDENKRKAMRDSAPAAATGLISTAAGTAAARAAVGARLDGQASDPALGLPTGARP
jgi:Tfp pilus assembly protein PilN